MNKRIQQIIQDSGLYIAHDNKEVTNKELEYFAELIIRKCAKVADLADENKCEWIGGNILNHFGVKE